MKTMLYTQLTPVFLVPTALRGPAVGRNEDVNLMIRKFVVDKGAKVTIGRESASQALHASKSNALFHGRVVSRQHGALENVGGQLFYEDTRSYAGSRVNDKVVRGGDPVKLSSGDVVTLSSAKAFARMVEFQVFFNMSKLGDFLGGEFLQTRDYGSQSLEAPAPIMLKTPDSVEEPDENENDDDDHLVVVSVGPANGGVVEAKHSVMYKETDDDVCVRIDGISRPIANSDPPVEPTMTPINTLPPDNDDNGTRAMHSELDKSQEESTDVEAAREVKSIDLQTSPASTAESICDSLVIVSQASSHGSLAPEEGSNSVGSSANGRLLSDFGSTTKECAHVSNTNNTDPLADHDLDCEPASRSKEYDDSCCDSDNGSSFSVNTDAQHGVSDIGRCQTLAEYINNVGIYDSSRDYNPESSTSESECEIEFENGSILEEYVELPSNAWHSANNLSENQEEVASNTSQNDESPLHSSSSEWENESNLDESSKSFDDDYSLSLTSDDSNNSSDSESEVKHLTAPHIESHKRMRDTEGENTNDESDDVKPPDPKRLQQQGPSMPSSSSVAKEIAKGIAWGALGGMITIGLLASAAPTGI
jgi:pSer/pThr/pTyr-binding forkhead associated (FHA) protein